MFLWCVVWCENVVVKSFDRMVYVVVDGDGDVCEVFCVFVCEVEDVCLDGVCIVG